MTPDLLARALQEFLAASRSALVLEDGQVLFDLESAQYSISSEKDRCLLHLWSQERNLVRHVVDCELKSGTLMLTVRRFGQARPIKMEICRDRNRRPPTVQKATRSRYARLLERAVRRETPGWTLDKARLSTSMDLERSFSPVYARGLLRKGRSAFAVMGVNQQETQSSIDAALTFALLWLNACREREAGRSVVEGLRLYVPPKTSATIQIRLAHLNHNAAKFQLFEFDESDESCNQVDLSDHGNIQTRLVRFPDAAQVRSRFAATVSRIMALAPQAEIAVISSTELSFRLHGLELARVRLANAPGTFQVAEEVIFGPPGYETRLSEGTASAFAEFIKTVVEARSMSGDRRDPLWRIYPERWLESLIFKNVTAVDSSLDPAHVYSQVPAFSASDRAMIDVLTCTRDARLAVLELKADEDIHLPLQGLDYWARVLWHHNRGEFQQYGYFSGLQLSPRPPLLLLVAPSLRVHPATDTLLRYFSPAIECSLIGVDERWREGIKVIYRKSSPRSVSA
ncbi:MAG TPA: hypothetical protein VGQ12_05175 [Candidatus Angelobacter sp.]|jgi:hypothetical protein|nr:hypothetical protein [Candidatus Angelobacter sp.]